MIQISPAIENPYKGTSLLCFSHEKLSIHPNLRKPSRIKQIPSNLTDYDQTINPPFTDDTIHTKESLPSFLLVNAFQKDFMMVSTQVQSQPLGLIMIVRNSIRLNTMMMTLKILLLQN